MTNISDCIKQLKKKEEFRREYLNRIREEALLWMEKEKDTNIKNRLLNLTPEQFTAASFDYLNRLIHSPKLSLDERKKNYENLKPFINELGEIFRKFIQGMNEYAEFMGYSNYLEFFLALRLIPNETFKSFSKNIDNFINLVNNDYLGKEIASNISDWSPVNIPDPAVILDLSSKFNLPDEVLDLVSKYDFRFLQYKNRIEIEFNDDNSFSARYNSERDKVIIRAEKKHDSITETLNFVNLLGRALDTLECIDNKVVPFDVISSLKERSAIEFTHGFIKTALSEKDQQIVRFNLLYNLVETLFEIIIYTKDKVDFDEVYANIINRCYPMAQQVKNPLYVFRQPLIFRPLDLLVYDIVNLELYLEDEKSK